MTHPPLAGHRVVQQTEPPEIDLQLVTRFAISDPHRRTLPTARTELGRDEPLHRALRHHHAVASQQLADLHAGNTRVHPRLDLVVSASQRRPRLTMTVRAVRAHDLHHPTQHQIGQLDDTTLDGDANLDRSVDIAAHRLAIHQGQPGHCPKPLTAQPQPQHFSNLEHRNLPEHHRRLSDCQQKRRCSPVTAPN